MANRSENEGEIAFFARSTLALYNSSSSVYLLPTTKVPTHADLFQNTTRRCTSRETFGRLQLVAFVTLDLS
jgi:hypothetical protein